MFFQLWILYWAHNPSIFTRARSVRQKDRGQHVAIKGLEGVVEGRLKVRAVIGSTQFIKVILLGSHRSEQIYRFYSTYVQRLDHSTNVGDLILIEAIIIEFCILIKIHLILIEMMKMLFCRV